VSALPGILAEIAGVAGLKAALLLASARGGTRVYLSPRLRDNNWLTQIVGREAAAKIVRHFVAGKRGCHVSLPLGPAGSRAQRWHSMRQMVEQEKSAAEIARAHGIDLRTAERYRAKTRKPRRRAPDLFS
jgi:hypothetical protein